MSPLMFRSKAFIFMVIFGAAIFGWFYLSLPVFASHVNPNIPPLPLPNDPERHGWNDVIGWIDFGISKAGTEHHAVEVADTEIKGYASSSVGFIALNCDSAPKGDFCDKPAGVGQWKVSNDGKGNLAGWAWNDNIGWISFCGNSSGGSTWDSANSRWVCPTNPSYQATIITNPGLDQGDFAGWAWNDVAGWISFNCGNTQTCGQVKYKVKTRWKPGGGSIFPGNLTSSIFDTCPTGVNCGATPNTIMWQGTQPTSANNYVRFQIATDCNFSIETPPNCPSGWFFIGATGFGSYYGPAGPDTPIKINPLNHTSKRYFRYKVFLGPCDENSSPACDPPQSPVVHDVIINWSP